jgi:hypothetical protein
MSWRDLFFELGKRNQSKMTRKAMFTGLIEDETGRVVTTTSVGEEPFYIVDDDGFKRHIPSDQVDCQVLEKMREQITGNEDILSKQTAKMLGSDDIFSQALIESQLKNIDKQFDSLLEMGIPEESRAYMGMLGFRVVINLHGDLVRLEQPAATTDGDE